MNVAGNRAWESTKHRGTVAAAEGIVRNTKSTAERLLVTGRPKTTSSTPTDKSMGTLEDIKRIHMFILYLPDNHDLTF